VRLDVVLSDGIGEVAGLPHAIVEQGGYLSVCAGYYPEEGSESWVSVVKVTNLSQDGLVELISSLEEMQILDVREV
jgi:hypothetical protein